MRLQYYVQAPLGLAAQSVLAAAALSVQGKIDVVRGQIGQGPTSLFCLSIAESGDRKSTIDKLALQPIRDYEQARQAEMHSLYVKYKAQLETWNTTRNAILKSYNKKIGGEFNLTCRDDLQASLCDVDSDKPVEPRRPNITFEEPTSEGIYRHFLEGELSAGLFSDEAISFFGGHGMTDESRGRTIAMLSKLWDGSAISRTRAAPGESGLLVGRRLSSHLMLQPIVSDKIFSDSLLMGQGFMARFLISQDDTLAGTRFLQGRNLSLGPSNDPFINNYWEALAGLLRYPTGNDTETGVQSPKKSLIKDEAFLQWCILHDRIEQQLGDNGNYVGIKPFASKAAENMARIASILSMVEGYEHPTIEHIKRSGIIMDYYLRGLLKNSATSEKNKEEELLNDLYQWIKGNGGYLHCDSFKLLPRKYRNAQITRQLLDMLVSQGCISIDSFNKKGAPTSWKGMNQH